MCRKISTKRRIALEEIRVATTLKSINDLLICAKAPSQGNRMESRFAVQLMMKRLKLLLDDGRACYREEIPAELSTLDHWFSKREDITKDPEFFLMFGNSCLAKSDFSTALTYAEKGLAEVTTLIQDSVSTKGQESKRVLALEKLKEDLTDLKHGAQLKISKQEKGPILTVGLNQQFGKGQSSGHKILLSLTQCTL